MKYDKYKLIDGKLEVTHENEYNFNNSKDVPKGFGDNLNVALIKEFKGCIEVVWKSGTIEIYHKKICSECDQEKEV